MERRQKRIIKTIILIIIVLLLIAMLFFFFLPKKKGIVAIGLDITINPILMTNNEVDKYLTGGGSFHFTEDSEAIEYMTPLNLEIWSNSYVKDVYTLKNVGDAEIGYSISIEDLNSENYLISYSTQEGYELPFEGITTTIKPNDEQTINVFIRISDTCSDAVMSGTLMLNVYSVEE